MDDFLLSTSQRGSVHSVAQEISRYAEQIAATGKEMLHLSVGAPSTGAPAKALAQFTETMKHNIFPYSPAHGIAHLRERISQMYHDTYNLKVNADNILITVGASAAFLLSFYALFDRGDKVAIPVPCYCSYLRILDSLGLDVQLFETTLENHFQPTVEDIKKLGKDIKGLLIISPSNPTGSMIPPDQFKQIADYCKDNDIILVSDEIYHNIVYQDTVPQTSALAFKQTNIIVLNSFSKYYSMPGWRLGWMVIPDNLIDKMRSIARAFFISPPTPSQYVALSAMDCDDELQSHIQRYRENREYILEGMPKAGYDRFPSLDGAFYFYAHVQHLHHDSITYCKAMIKELGIVTTPGIAFDPLNGEHYVRFSFSGSTETIKKSIKLLQSWDHNVN